MSNAFLYLIVCSTRNRVRKRLRRLREPRYLAGAVVGLAYLYLVFLRPRTGRRRGGGYPRLSEHTAGASASLQLAGTFVLWLMVIARWVVPVSTQPLAMTGAESHLLLGAPVSRTSVVRYKLLRAQTGILLSSGLMLIFAWSAVSSAWSFVIGTFLLFTTARLHLLGAALSRRAMFGRERGALDPIAWLVFAFILGASAAACWALALGLRTSLATHDWAAGLAALRQAASQPLIAVALFPFAAMVRLVFAAWPSEFLAALGPAIVLGVLNFAWVVHAEGLAERCGDGVPEAASEERPRRVTRPANRPAPFRLAPAGPPELAILWKNLILFSRYASVGLLLRLVLVAVVLAFAVGSRGAHVAAALVLPTAVLAGGFALIGPYSIRNDLRQDLLDLSIIKTWPVAAERVLWGEVLSPAVVVTAIDWLLIAVALALSLAVPASALAWPDRLAFAASAAILAPAIVLAQTIIQNTAVVLFPGWVTVGPRQPRGVDAMGQQMLLLGATLLLLVVGLIPGAVFGGGFVLLARPWIGWLSLVPAALLISGLIVAEGWVAIHLLGKALERADPAVVDAGN